MFSIKKTRNTSGLSKNYDLPPATAWYKAIAVNMRLLFIRRNKLKSSRNKL